jgi:hypothetical protein
MLRFYIKASAKKTWLTRKRKSYVCVHKKKDEGIKERKALYQIELKNLNSET